MSRKENALDLAKFIDKGVRVKLSGGREGAPLVKAEPQHTASWIVEHCGLELR